MFRRWFKKDEEEIVEEIDNESPSKSQEEKEKDLLRFDKPKSSLFNRLLSSLEKTRSAFTNQIDELLKGYAKIDEELFEDMEDILVSADIGVQTTINIMDELREDVRKAGVTDPMKVKDLLIDKLSQLIEKNEGEAKLNSNRPIIILVIGVNGVGKTTSIGKLAHNLIQEGDKVMLAAADTFRAAAIDQLKIWSERAGADIVYQQEGADPASVVFDGIQKMKANNSDVLICDTAGRLHNKANLMNELEKIHRIIKREHPDADLESLLVLDATTGQNALSQAKEFAEVANPTGIILTKLDGTAKGGVVFPLLIEYKIPVKYIGIGEGIDDLEEFDSQDFVKAIFS